MFAQMTINVRYDANTVDPEDLQAALEHSLEGFVQIGGLQNTSEDADVLEWSSRVSIVNASTDPAIDGLDLYLVRALDTAGEVAVTYHADSVAHAVEQALDEPTLREVLSVERIEIPEPGNRD